jgi:hypothetical protein
MEIAVYGCQWVVQFFQYMQQGYRVGSSAQCHYDFSTLLEQIVMFYVFSNLPVHDSREVNDFVVFVQKTFVKAVESTNVFVSLSQKINFVVKKWNKCLQFGKIVLPLHRI